MRTKTLSLVAATAISMFLGFQGTAFAQGDTPAPPAASPAPAKFSVDSTPIEALVANARAKAVVDKTLPGIESHPSYDQFKAMTLKDVAPYSNGAITPEKLTEIQAGLDQLASASK
jgi:hypothetical protein